MVPLLGAVGPRISHVTSRASAFHICIMRIVNWVTKPGVVASHSCNPCTSEVRQEDQKSRVFSCIASWSQPGLFEVHKTKTKTTKWLIKAQLTTVDQQSMFFPFGTVFFSLSHVFLPFQSYYQTSLESVWRNLQISQSNRKGMKGAGKKTMRQSLGICSWVENPRLWISVPVVVRQKALGKFLPIPDSQSPWW